MARAQKKSGGLQTIPIRSPQGLYGIMDVNLNAERSPDCHGFEAELDSTILPFPANCAANPLSCGVFIVE